MGSCSGTEIGLNSECNKEKWDFIAKEKGWGAWVENY